MLQIVNYLDLSKKEKRHLPAQLAAVNFFPAHGGYSALRRELNHSVPEHLPQFLLVREAGEVVGYLFLISNLPGFSRVLPWCAVSNCDELDGGTAVELLQTGCALAQQCGAEELAHQLDAQRFIQQERRDRNIIRTSS